MTETGLETALLEKRSDVVSTFVVGAHLVFAASPVYLGCALGLGWWLAPLMLWFGAGMNSVLNLMHECSHYHVFASRGACTALGRWILGPMALADFESYRQRHWEHHRSLGTDADPKYVYRTPIRGWGLQVLLVKCLSLFEPVQRFRMNARVAATKDSAVPDRRWIGRAILFHSLFVATLGGLALAVRREPALEVLVETGVVHAVVFLYGLAAITVFIASLRAIAEHQIGDDAARHQEGAALRNFRGNLFTRWLFGAYGFADHYTHHLKPAIPYYQLPRATRELAGRDPSVSPTHSYLETLRMLVQGETRST